MLLNSLNVCMQCGICSSACSVRFELNIRKLIAEFMGKKSFWNSQLWNCTSCRICQDRCPRNIKLAELIIEAKKNAIESGKVPDEIRKLLESTYKFGNPFGVGKHVKKKWMDDLNLKIAERDSFEYLFFVGCGVVSERVAEVARKTAELLKIAEVDFAVLENEDCCGNDVLSIGEEGLFELLKEKNRKIFEEHNVKKIITLSPHCYNAFKNYYGLEVYHTSQILLKAIKKAKIKFKNVFDAKVTYHDPCYLGRYNGIYEEPREVLKAVPNLKLVEMPRSRDLAICCGGGAGNIVRELKNRPSNFRINEAAIVGVDVVAVSCPFCLMMLEDAAKLNKSKIQIKDVAEIIYDSVFDS
ncbi:MAG: (Fe-S)-binding protein [Archaeoglobales archaeon]|nr:(Fe-S)-binding protein [Archaeoglobales archaeon]